MKTALQNFEQIISILMAVYPVRYNKESQVADISVTEEKTARIILEDTILTVIAGDDVNNVYQLDENTDAGKLSTIIEQILIDYAELKKTPCALQLYLYYSLLGIMWGVKASNKIKDIDPTPTHSACIYFNGRAHNKQDYYLYEYAACNSGIIKLTRVTPDYSSYGFTPEEYMQNPEKTIMEFFQFLKDIDYIESASQEKPI